MRYLLWMLIGYLSGGVMYSYWIPKLTCGRDICSLSDDGNPGAANAFKYAGIPAGLLAVCCDILKALLPVYLSGRVLDRGSLLYALVMAAPVVGHAFPFLFGRQGGKAIAASFGVMLGLYPNWDPLLLLAFFYLLFSLVVVIRPHFYRSILTYGLFAVCCLPYVQEKGTSVGILLCSATVIAGHLAHYRGERPQVRLFLLRKKNGEK